MSAHWRLVRAMFWLFCIFSVTSCAAIRGAPEAPRPAAEAQEDSKYLIASEALTEYLDITVAEDKRTARNEFIDERILEIDTQYGRYEEQMWRERVGGNIAVDWTLLALSGATATLGGKELKAVLGATSTGVLGARESFDKQAFFEATLPTLFAQMVAERKKVKAHIAVSKRNSAADYTIYAAMSDLLELVRAGTIRGVLEAIALDAGSKERDAVEIVRDETFKVSLRPRIENLQTQIRALSKEDAMSLASELPVTNEDGLNTVKLVYGSGFATDEDNVKDALETFVSFMNWTEDNVRAFETALAKLGR